MTRTRFLLAALDQEVANWRPVIQKSGIKLD